MNDIFELSDSDNNNSLTYQEPLWLKTLNPEQREAVIHTNGPLLVLSGAGTGKTRVLVSKLAYIIFNKIANPWNCLAVTFTNKAANEMKARVSEMTGVEVSALWLGTFHSICAKILRRHAEKVSLKSNFTIIDDNDQKHLITTIMQEFGLDTKKFLPKAMVGIISRWKDQALTPDKVTPYVIGYDFADGFALKIYKEYNNRLKTMNSADFGDLILLCINLFTANQDILNLYQDKFRYIMVDEYQDTNVSQYLWLRLLAMKYKNICCVGDDDQSIYSWRGAEISNILNFEKDFNSAKTVRLERNYRSTKNILDGASNLIAFNKQRLGKRLFPAFEKDEENEQIKVIKSLSSEDEVTSIIEEIESEQRHKTPLSQMAILVRTAALTRNFEEKLVAYGIPYRVIGGLRFYERMEIRDVIAYLRILLQPDDSLAFERVINKPKRGIGDKTLDTIKDYANRNNLSYFMAAYQLIENKGLPTKVSKTIDELIKDFARWHNMLDDKSPRELVKIILEETGYLEMWQKDKSQESASRVENIKELLSVLDDNFASIAAFLDHVSLVMDKNSDNYGTDYLSIMTIHAAKGLEFDNVFLPAWEENIFPHSMTLSENGENGVEEERRLAYVAITRARKKVFISFAYSRFIYGNWQNNVPSRFIDEIGLDNIVSDKDTNQFSQLSEMSFDWQRIYAKKAQIQNNVFHIGDKVFHKRFGNGTIISMDCDKLEIDFDDSGLKKIISSFVEVLR
ncbi:MAG: ATP-dependent helicase [Alphaproteobacteria bacterium]